MNSYNDWTLDQDSAPDKGAFGSVRRVRRLLPGTSVSQVGALKELRRDADPRHNSLIDAEIAAISRFSSPYVPRYFDSGVDHVGNSWGGHCRTLSNAPYGIHVRNVIVRNSRSRLLGK